MHPSVQPIPSPLNPPTNVQVIFTSKNKGKIFKLFYSHQFIKLSIINLHINNHFFFSMLLAMIRWDAPSKQIQRGCCAWREWKYDVFIKPHLTEIETAGNDNVGDELKIMNISENHLLFTNFSYLQHEFKTFVFTVRATSFSGTVIIIRISMKYILKLEK